MPQDGLFLVGGKGAKSLATLAILALMEKVFNKEKKVNISREEIKFAGPEKHILKDKALEGRKKAVKDLRKYSKFRERF